MKKSLKFVFLIFLVFSIISLFLINKTENFITAFFDQPSSRVFSQLILARQKPTLTNDINFIVLGLDYRNDSLENTQTTDTIILTNIKNGQISILSLPRDLWDSQTNFKINQIYPISLETSDKYKFIQDNFSRITGQKISKTIVFTTEDLRNLISFVNGVDVYLEKGFVDDQYPNPDYINNPSPDIPIYKTIKFNSGWNHIDNSNITEFVRSRKSIENGTDLGRIQRQQLLLQALLQKIQKNPSQINFPAIYQYWHRQISTNINLTDLFSILFSQYSYLNNFSLKQYSLEVGLNSNQGHIYHPNQLVQGQWVFLPVGNNFNLLQKYIRQYF